MRILSFNKFMILIMVLPFSIAVCEAQSFERPPAPKQSKGLMNKSPGRRKQVKIRKPMTASKAKREQETNEKKLKRDYKKFVRDNRKRALEIQTPDVRERMKQNRKDADSNYKAKKKAISSKGKKAGKKYS